MKRLEKKVAVIYGNGVVGITVAKVFAKEGAQWSSGNASVQWKIGSGCNYAGRYL
jgi:hypothetical protein